MLSWLHFVTFFPTCFSAQPFVLLFHSVPVLSYCKFVHNLRSKTPRHLFPLYFTPLTRPYSLLHLHPLSVSLSQPLPPQHPCHLSPSRRMYGGLSAASCPTPSRTVEALCWSLPVLSTGRSHGLPMGSATFRCAPLPSNTPVSPQDECQ